MATSALLSSVVTGAALLVILAVVLRLRHWQHPSPAGAAEGVSTLVTAANGPFGWSVAFFVVAFAITGLGVGYVSGAPVMGVAPATIGLLAGGVLALTVGVAGLIAVYGAVRTRGLNSAQAAGLSSVALATLFLVAIVAQLLFGG